MTRREISTLNQKMNGKKNKFFLYFITTGGVYVLSVVFAVMMRHRDSVIAKTNLLYEEVNKITQQYQMKQIAASVFLFFLGYLAVMAILPEVSELQKMVLAVPTAIATWGIASVVMLLLRVPYTKQLMFSLFGFLAASLFYINRKHLTLRQMPQFLIKFFIVASFANVFSTGIVRYTVTSDTYYCIYTYGRLIAADEKLMANTLGDMIEQTGIMPALMVSFAVFCGFETIQVIHYILMTSFMVGLIVYLYKVFEDVAVSKWKSISMAILLMIVATAPLFLMYSLMLSHSWMMVYIFICSIYMYECMNDRINQALRKRLICFISFLLSWMSLCRIEAVVSVIFMIICFSYLGISKKELIVLSIPSIAVSTIFHLEMQFLIWKADNPLPYGSVFVTGKVLAVMGLSVFLLGFYIVAYERKRMIVFRRHLPILSIATLLAAIFVLCLSDIDRTVNNFHSIFYNLAHERWYYFPHLVLLLLIVILKNKKVYGYWDMLVFGMVLTSFAMCMGRIHYLRDGWGDSFNRYMLYLVPIMLVYLTKEISLLVHNDSENI